MIPQSTLPTTIRSFGLVVWLATTMFVASLMPVNLIGQDSEGSSKVSIGLDGNVRLGKWSPVFVKADSSANPAKFEIQLLDGHDNPLVYSGDLSSTGAGDYQACIRLGRKYGNVKVRISDDNGAPLEEWDFPIAGEGKVALAHKSTRRMLVTLEPEKVFCGAIESSSGVGRGKNQPIISVLDSHEKMPVHWLGYECADAMLMVTSDLERIETYLPEQIAAIESWVENGGRLVVSSAANSEKLFGPGGSLEGFSPGTFSGLGNSKTSNRLETYADSDEQLIPLRGEPISISTFSGISGTTLIEDNKRTPLVIRKPIGFGEVVFVCFDLDSPRVTGWSGFSNLVGRLVSRQTTTDEGATGQQSVKGTSVSTFGYKDLVGQLGVPLDRFSKVRFVAFTWIALLIGLYILCIGPGDFFFLKRLLGKMELTWLTFPLLALLFCGLAYGISKMTRPNTIQMNQLELLDVDTVEGKTRGSVWSNLYSPRGGTCKIEFDEKHNMGFELDSSLISWHGLPGDGLGGMWSGQTPGLTKTSYGQVVELKPNQQIESSLVELPLQVSSTKPMFGQWWSDTPFPVRSKLVRKSGRLGGTVKNPFDFRLKNCKLLYETWAYELKNPLEGSAVFDLLTETKEKKLRASLTRKFKSSNEANRSNNTAWDPADTRLERIAMMLMFYQAAGGSNYTGLSHDYQSYVDMTDSLLPNRAILVGEIDKPGAEVLIDGERASDKYDETVTLVRILLPVTVK